MTTIFITPPAISHEITREQMARHMAPSEEAYLSNLEAMHRWEDDDFAEWAEARISVVARAEGRHPSAVLADIVGPAAGVVGAGCYPASSTFEATEARFECKVKMGLVRWMMGDSAAHGAGESEE